MAYAYFEQLKKIREQRNVIIGILYGIYDFFRQYQYSGSFFRLRTQEVCSLFRFIIKKRMVKLKIRKILRRNKNFYISVHALTQNSAVMDLGGIEEKQIAGKRIVYIASLVQYCCESVRKHNVDLIPIIYGDGGIRYRKINFAISE
jgi:hypothetical protein